MSLVAYTVESDDESSEEDESGETITKIEPQPITNVDNNASDSPLIFAQLPKPKPTNNRNELHIEEKDDEFLHKKAQVKTNKVKIGIPAMRDFKNVDMKYRDTIRDPDARPLRPAAGAAPDGTKTSKLLSLLPSAKSERNFMKASNKIASPNITVKKSHFIPDTVRLGRAARNTEGLDEIKTTTTTTTVTQKRKLVENESTMDSDDNEGETGDFFSFNETKQSDLPEVSLNEINAMLAVRSAKIASTADTYLQQHEEQQDDHDMESESGMAVEAEESGIQISNVELDGEVLRTLAGRTAAKRAKHDNEQVQVLDIKGSQIMPSRDEWMRTALAASTSYQPTGQLNDEEPQAGTRRKHQITYLAHKAKANEAELQAMWAANRQTRRATQSKYGF